MYVNKKLVLDQKSCRIAAAFYVGSLFINEFDYVKVKYQLFLCLFT